VWCYRYYRINVNFKLAFRDLRWRKWKCLATFKKWTLSLFNQITGLDRSRSIWTKEQIQQQIFLHFHVQDSRWRHRLAQWQVHWGPAYRPRLLLVGWATTSRQRGPDATLEPGSVCRCRPKHCDRSSTQPLLCWHGCIMNQTTTKRPEQTNPINAVWYCTPTTSNYQGRRRDSRWNRTFDPTPVTSHMHAVRSSSVAYRE